MKIKPLLLMAALAIAIPAHADFSGKVVDVLDGGRVIVDTGKQNVIVNMRSLITPFPNQNVYEQSRLIFENMFIGQNVRVATKDTIGSRCIYGELYSGGINLNEALLMTGFAWIYNEHTATQRYLDIEAQNKETEKGLWQPDFHFHFNTIPWEPHEMAASCIAIGVTPSVDEKDQYSFYAEKNKFGVGFWLNSLIIGVVIGFSLWFIIFWIDGLGLDLLKHFRRKSTKSKDIGFEDPSKRPPKE